MRNKNTGDRPALFALISLIVVFFAVVGFGWHKMFSNWSSGFFAWVLGFVLASVAISLAYATASERVRFPHALKVASAYFFVLFLISALGTINTMFLTFEGITIVREEIDSAREALNRLKDKAPELLQTRDYENYENNVKERWGALKTEIENPQLCGQGPVAAQRIVELQEVLTAFRPLSSAGCEKIPSMIFAYEKQINLLKNSSQQYQAAAPTIALRTKIITSTENNLKELEYVRKNLKVVGDIDKAKEALFNAAEVYDTNKTSLDTALRKKTDLPDKISTSSLDALGNIGQVVQFIFSRLNKASTYFYVGTALFLDIVLVLAFARILKTGTEAWEKGLGAKTNWL